MNKLQTPICVVILPLSCLSRSRIDFNSSTPRSHRSFYSEYLTRLNRCYSEMQEDKRRAGTRGWYGCIYEQMKRSRRPGGGHLARTCCAGINVNQRLAVPNWINDVVFLVLTPTSIDPYFVLYYVCRYQCYWNATLIDSCQARQT